MTDELVERLEEMLRVGDTMEVDDGRLLRIRAADLRAILARLRTPKAEDELVERLLMLWDQLNYVREETGRWGEELDALDDAIARLRTEPSGREVWERLKHTAHPDGDNYTTIPTDLFEQVYDLLRPAPSEDGWPGEHMVEAAWGIIANAYGGDWEAATPEWREAAERWRDAYQHLAHSEDGGIDIDIPGHWVTDPPHYGSEFRALDILEETHGTITDKVSEDVRKRRESHPLDSSAPPAGERVVDEVVSYLRDRLDTDLRAAAHRLAAGRAPTTKEGEASLDRGMVRKALQICLSHPEDCDCAGCEDIYDRICPGRTPTNEGGTDGMGS